MKQNFNLKKIFIKATVGVPIGITLLMISYVFIYIVFGNEIFNSDLNKLHNVNILVLQLISSGISGYILLLYYNYMLSTNNAEYDKKALAHPWKNAAFSMLIVCLAFAGISAPMLNFYIFSPTCFVSYFFVIGICFLLISPIVIVKSIIESKLIKKINKKLHERKSEKK